MENKDETSIMISVKEYKRLYHKAIKLEMLEDYGVDNWSGYGDALTLFGTGEKDYNTRCNEQDQEIDNEFVKQLENIERY